MVARTDTYGAYIWNGTGWDQLLTTSRMPDGVYYGGGVYEIRLAPTNSNTIYMAALGKVYKSTDRGEHWVETGFAQVWQDPNIADRMDGQKMAVDPFNENIVYVGTQQNGLFVTRDGGNTWQHVDAVPQGADAPWRQDPGLTGIVFDPGSGTQGGRTQTIYVGTAGSGVFRSTDGGNTWTALTGGPKDVSHAKIGPDGTYYAVGHSDSTVWKFDDGVWTALLNNRVDIHTLAIDPFNAQHIIVMMGGGALVESKDGGQTWGDGWNWAASLESSNDIPWLEDSGGYMSTGGLWFDPNVEGRLWQSAGVGVWSTDLPDRIDWWTPIIWNSHSQGIEQLVANDIIAPAGGDPILASWDRPFFTVTNPDQYATEYAGGHFSMGWSIDYASSDPSFIVGISDWWGQEDSGYSTDGGKTWHKFAGLPDRAVDYIGGSIAASSPTNIIWAPANGAPPSYTLDGGVTWHTVTIAGKTDWGNFAHAYYLNRTTVTADRVLPNTFYLYDIDTGLHVSTDGGVNWTLVRAGQISDWTFWNAKIETVPGSAGELYFTAGPSDGNRGGSATGQMFQHSTDGGRTWTAVAGVQEVLNFGFGKSLNPGGPAAVYIAGWVNGDYGIYMSNDASQTWTKIGEYPLESLDSVRAISGDMDIYGRVYIGFAGSGYAYLDVPAAGLPGTPTPPSNVPTNTLPTAPATKSVVVTEDTPTSPIAVGATDADGDPLGYAIKAGFGPAKGSVAFANGSFVYTPTANANGNDSFTIVVSDGKGGSAEQLVNVAITAVNDAPIAAATKAIAVTAGANSGAVAIGASDPDGDALSYGLKPGAYPAKGTISFAGSDFLYTPTIGTAGSDSFTILISDGKGGTFEQVVNVTIGSPTNRAPTAQQSRSLTTNEDASTGAVSIGATDADGDPLGYAIKAGFGPAKGSVAFANGSFVYTPTANANGNDSFTIVVSDGKGGSVEQLVNVAITAVNDAPVAAATKAIAVTAGANSGAVAIGASDPDGDALSYGLKPGAYPAKGTISFAGSDFLYTPTIGTAGSDSFTILISDGKGGTFEQVVNVTIGSPTNRAPTAQQSRSITTNEDASTGAVSIGATDADGDPLGYAIKAGFGPAKGDVSFANGKFTYTPFANANGSDSFTILISDGQGGSTEQRVVIGIAGVNDAPTAPAMQSLAAAAGVATAAIAINASDIDGDALGYHVKAGFGPTKGAVAFTDGAFIYTPGANASGSDSFTLVVSDGHGGAAEQTINIQIAAANSAPSAFRLITPDGFAGAVGGTGMVFGSNGHQDITVLGDAGVVTFDGSFARGGDVIRVPGFSDDYTAMLRGSFLVLDNGANRVEIPVGPAGTLINFTDGNLTLSFDMTLREVRLGDMIISTEAVAVHATAGIHIPLAGAADAAAPTARLVLSNASEVSIAGNVKVFGSNGSETLNILHGNVTLDGSFSRGGDTVRLHGGMDEYRAYVTASNLQLLGDNGASVLIPIGRGVTYLDFEGDLQTAWFDAAEAVVRLGQHAVDAATPQGALWLSDLAFA